MMFVVSVLLLISCLALLGGGGYVVFKIRRVILWNIEEIANYFESPSQDVPSDFVKTVDWIAEDIGASVGRHVNASQRGQISAQTKAMTKELETVAVEENPQLAMTEMLPKSLKKNPLAMMGLQAILNRANSGQGFPSVSPSPRGNGRTKFNL